MIQHESSLTVRYAETDQMRFAHHANYIIWFERGRIGLMKHFGVSYAQLENDGYLMPVIEVGANYFKPARFDQQLTIRTSISEKPRAKVRFEYRVLNEAGELLCSGFSLHSFMNKQDRAIKPPKVFLQKIQDFF
jgi:acyl-CoA thioester hydrolase